ncbi:hypothetical protein EC957_010334 [Mortierella hygrophila]|uniref:Uncharacterized protein n=1 Tax=Mortierella hygrophila TaxID=979708 RepID=A0A9P6FAY1_9FUNG|nr:hypothetical protein EC957_010334 [Mortierella hygrophila]
MSKGKEFIVSWDDIDDDDLFDEDPIEPSQQSAPAKDDATPTAAAVAPARIFRKPESANLTPTNESYVGKQDLRNENKQLNTSSSNINTPGRFRPVSGTSEGSNHHIDSSWKGESDWRSNRMRTSKPMQPVKEDLRDAIRTMTRQMKDLESPGIRTTKSIRTPQSRPLESGITLFGPQAVIIFRPTIRFGRDCSTTKMGQLSTEESLWESLKRQGVQESQKVQESVKGAVMESVKKAVMESIQRQSKKSVQGSIKG